MRKKHPIRLLALLFLFTIFTLSGCVSKGNTDQSQLNNNAQSSGFSGESEELKRSETNTWQAEFIGETGEQISIINSQIALDSQVFNDGLARFYNTELQGKTIYFFVIKDKDGIYRAAANACQVCFNSRTGFRQEGDYMVCNSCQNKYPLEKIATEKGGCNPAPINPNLEVKNGQIIINQQDLERVAKFF
ncbi:DUF2318 domain-containing protein [Patescibacteria group bacterium]|nr:DUF2318 domain-containing protein [Patescibacteria group bacterium]